ncbi:MAG: hypothetical protein K6T29_08985, partial [Peptococcaceae bacterium]|nr:hypothetical protein [Peptococcaceae bacterium]
GKGGPVEKGPPGDDQKAVVRDHNCPEGAMVRRKRGNYVPAGELPRRNLNGKGCASMPTPFLWVSLLQKSRWQRPMCPFLRSYFKTLREDDHAGAVLDNFVKNYKLWYDTIGGKNVVLYCGSGLPA